jgi:DNA polymerase
VRDLYLDLETYNTVSVTVVGAYRYAETAEVMLISKAWDDLPASVWDCTEADYLPQLQQHIDLAERVICHGPFDRVVLARQGVTIPLEKQEDTMVQALAHGLPAKLETLSDILALDMDKAKAKEGKKLINLFCSPTPKNWRIRRATRETHEAQWEAFVDYARLDVEAMREVRRRVPRWNMTPREREYWMLDQETNALGMAVDIEHAEAAIAAFGRGKEIWAAETYRLTGGAVGSTTQRDALLAHLRATYGYSGADLTADTIEKILRGKVHPNMRALLELRQKAAATSPAKYTALLKAVNADGRLRGGIQFCGASRTGRDAGRIFQPQNLPRPSLSREAIAIGAEAMKLGCEDLLFDVSELCVSAVRGSIIAGPGNQLLVCDLSGIEGRVLAWIAGEEWKVKAFRDYDNGIGEDNYKVTAGKILGKEPQDVTKLERQETGKVSELACGYQGSLGAMRRMGGKAVEAMSDDQIYTIVRGWRANHPQTVKFWYAMETAAIAAIRHPKESFACGLITFSMKTGPDGTPYLRMRLPSGRYLCYMNPKGGADDCVTCGGKGVLRADETAPFTTCPACGGDGSFGGEGISYDGVDQYTRQWIRLDTYGGKLTENAVQAIARDIFFHGMRLAVRAGFPIVLRVHDELVAEVPIGGSYTLEELSQYMVINPSWALTLPLAAAGFEAHRYHKD